MRRSVSYLGFTLVLSCIASGAFASLEDTGDPESNYWREAAGQPVPEQFIVTFNENVASVEEGMKRCAQAGRLMLQRCRLQPSSIVHERLDSFTGIPP